MKFNISLFVNLPSKESFNPVSWIILFISLFFISNFLFFSFINSNRTLILYNFSKLVPLKKDKYFSIKELFKLINDVFILASDCNFNNVSYDSYTSFILSLIFGIISDSISINGSFFLPLDSFSISFN